MQTAKFEEYASDMEGVFVNIDWRQHDIQAHLEEFKKLRFKEAFIDNGILFIWADKQIIADIIEFFEAQDFKYVENLIIAQISPTKIASYSKTEKDRLGKRSNLFSYFSQPTKKLVQDSMGESDINNTSIIKQSIVGRRLGHRFAKYQQRRGATIFSCGAIRILQQG